MERSRSRGTGSGSNGNSNGSGRGYSGGGKRPSGSSRTVALVAALAVLVVAGVGVIVWYKSVVKNTNNPGGTVSPTATGTNPSDSNTFFAGVSVDGIDLGGLTRDQAAKKIKDQQDQTAAKTTVTLTKDNTTVYTIKLSDVTRTYDTESILDQAWQQGRSGSDSERQAAIEALKTNPVKLATTITADPTALKDKLAEITAPFLVQPKDAAYVSCDQTKPVDQRLTLSPDVPGQQVDGDALWNAIQQAFEKHTYGSIPIPIVPLPATLTLTQLQANLTLLQTGPTGSSKVDKSNANDGHSFTTRIINTSKPRLTNIDLGNKAVNSHGWLLPGQELSVNDSTGPRNAAAGYQIAPIDRSGVVDQGLGGGMCQVSGTLYNAAIRYGGKYEVKGSDAVTAFPNGTADQLGIAVVARDSHSLPSAYLSTGTDATVDIASGKDLKIRNDFKTPILVVMYYDKNSKGEYYEHCDIYGPALPDGATFTLARKNTATLTPDPNIAPKTVHSNYAAPGAPVYIAPANGYSVDVYIQKTVGGNMTEFKAYHDTYPPQPAAYYVYTGETAPTPTPSATPTGEATATPGAPTPTPSPAPTHTPSPTPEPATPAP